MVKKFHLQNIVFACISTAFGNIGVAPLESWLAVVRESCAFLKLYAPIPHHRIIGPKSDLILVNRAERRITNEITGINIFLSYILRSGWRRCYGWIICRCWCLGRYWCVCLLWLVRFGRRCLFFYQSKVSNCTSNRNNKNNDNYIYKSFLVHMIKNFLPPTSTLLSASKIKIWFEPTRFAGASARRVFFSGFPACRQAGFAVLTQ